MAIFISAQGINTRKFPTFFEKIPSYAKSLIWLQPLRGWFRFRYLDGEISEWHEIEVCKRWEFPKPVDNLEVSLIADTWDPSNIYLANNLSYFTIDKLGGITETAATNTQDRKFNPFSFNCASQNNANFNGKFNTKPYQLDVSKQDQWNGMIKFIRFKMNCANPNGGATSYIPFPLHPGIIELRTIVMLTISNAAVTPNIILTLKTEDGTHPTLVAAGINGNNYREGIIHNSSEVYRTRVDKNLHSGAFNAYGTLTTYTGRDAFKSHQWLRIINSSPCTVDDSQIEFIVQIYATIQR